MNDKRGRVTKIIFWALVLGPAVWVGKALPLSYIMEKNRGYI